MFVVIGTDTFLQELEKWPKKDLAAIKKIYPKLALNPYVGKQLSYSFLREKKIGGRRVYYLVYEDLKLVLLVATSNKKNQQATIDHIRENLHEFKTVTRKIRREI